MNNQTDRLGSEKIGKLLFSMALPAITAQLVQLLYNLVDRMYIGHIEGVGKLALTGVGVTLPLIMLISAFAALISMGSAPRAGIFMGKSDFDTAETIMGNSASILVVVSVLLTVFFAFFSKNLLMMFGASTNTISYAMDYFGIYSLGTIFVQLTLGLNAFITAQGFAKTSMFTVLIGAICNIILDPIFIFVFGMGVKGAALATILSQAISAVWVVRFLLGKKTTLRLKKKNLKPQAKIILPCLALGLAPFIMQATESVLAVCFNASLLKYGGDVAVGAMTILNSAMQFSVLPLVGLTQGAGPIISYNFGAKNKTRVKQAFFMLLGCTCAFSLFFWGLVQIFPATFVKIFNSDPELVAFTVNALRIYMAAGFVMGVQLACQQTFIALGNAKSSLFLAVLRKILLLIPLIYILPSFMANKTNAIFLAEPVADVIAVIITAALFAVQFKSALKELDHPKEDPLLP